MSKKERITNPKQGENLKTVLIEQKLTQKKAAELFNYSEQHICNVIKGNRQLSLEFADRVIEKYPNYRREWLLGQDDAITHEVANMFLQREFGLKVKLFNYDNCMQENYVILSSLESGYNIRNVNGDMSIEQLADKRERLLLAEIQKRAEHRQNESLDTHVDSSNIFEILLHPEQYEIIQNSQVVACCDSTDIMKMNNKLRDYLSYLLYLFIKDQHKNMTSRNESSI